MRQFLLAIMVVTSLGACAANTGDPATSEQESALTQILGEKFDECSDGPIGSTCPQSGWSGDCVVVDGTLPNRYLKCTGGKTATTPLGLHGAGSYTLEVDLSPNENVVDTTHGKLLLEGPQGYVFQIIDGCNGIRVAFQASGPSQVLASFPCQSLTGPPKYRVVCKWSTSGTVLSCGAAALPADPTMLMPLTLPSPLRPFDTVDIMTFALPGASLYDKIFLWQN